VLQSSRRRTEQDVEQMIALGARVRLCKGAYQEPATVAFPGKRDVDTTYVGCMERLLLRGTYPGIATHDARIIEHAKTFARDKGVAPARSNFKLWSAVRGTPTRATGPSAISRPNTSPPGRRRRKHSRRCSRSRCTS